VAKQKIRIRLKAYDHKILDQSAQQIVETAERMGAQVALPGKDSKEGTIILVLSLLLGPFAVAAVALLLLLIAVMTISSLAFTVIWLAIIHKVFVLFAPHS
jgi:hypothetical protein